MRYLLIPLLVLITFCGCDNEDSVTPTPQPNPDAADIDAYLRDLPYDPFSLLDVQGNGGEDIKKKALSEPSTEQTLNQGYYEGCTTVEYNLSRNFSEISILRSIDGSIYPGALVVADRNLLDGVPRGLSVNPAPVTLRVDLPNIGDAGTFTVENPTNSIVGEELDKALAFWNENAYQEGYYNVNRSDYETSEAFSSTQAALDLGLNTKWASGSVASQLSVEQNTATRVAMLAYKQIFYTVTADQPRRPSDALASNVSLEDLQNVTSADSHPAYVSSVDYGRIIIFRLENSSSDLSVDLDAVMSYAAGAKVEVDLESSYKEALANSTIKVITIGGNGVAAAKVLENINAGPGALTPLIVEGATYSRENPAAPIAYKVNLLKDNSVVKMGFTTDYREKKCGNVAYDHAQVFFKNDFKTFNLKVRLTYKHKQPSDDETFQTPEVLIKDESSATLKDIPDGAYDVRLIVKRIDGVTFREWKNVGLGHISKSQDEDCWRAYRTGLSDGLKSKLVKCG